MKRSEAFPSQYMGKDDVPSPVTVTIKNVTGELVGQGAEAEEKRIAHFVETGIKPMILNSGNWQTIEAIANQPDDEHWGGTRIEIFVDPSVSFGGKRVGGLRVRESRNGQAPKQQSSAADPLRTAKAAAMRAWCELFPEGSKTTEQIRTGITTACADVFGLKPDQLTVAQWQQLVAYKFEKPLDQQAEEVFGGPGIPEEQVPF